jgi:Fe-S-cluster containining protein
MDKDLILAEIYLNLPELKCKGLCGKDICGPIHLSEYEFEKLSKCSGKKLNSIKHNLYSENKVLIRKNVRILTDVTCPLLTEDGKCSCYNVRPLICRLWGLTESMKCHFGCLPDRYLSDAEVYKLIEKELK